MRGRSYALAVCATLMLGFTVFALPVPAASALSASLRFVVPVACKASVLTASTRVTDDKSGHLIRNKTATLRIIQPHAS